MRRTAKFVVLPLLVLGFAFLLRASIPHVPTGTWQAGNPMAEARSGAASVLLSNGNVLITGGDAPTGTLNTAEVMSNAGIFSSVASMQSPRSGHTATALQDGRVLITGGITATGGGATNSAEVYDPSANSWTLVSGTMLAARSGHTASLLPDGRVLLAGGTNSGGPVSDLEIFDPSSDTFSGAGVLGSPVSQHAAATLADGRVLIAGGTDGTNALATTYLFDPSSNSITSGPNLSSPRMSASATTLVDGSVLVAGGNDGSSDLASAEIYDPAANTLSPAPSNLAVPRSGHHAFLLPNNNSVLILGGTSAGTDLASAQLYLAWTGNFQSTAAMSAPRPGLTASPLSVDGVLMAAGGSNLLSTEFYGFATVKTDQADYAPGSIVTITGSGWQPGETVTLSFLESPLIDTHPNVTAVADASGNIFNNQFSPDQYDLSVKFYLTAVGSQSGVQAQNTFTDQVKIGIAASGFRITSPTGAIDKTMNVSQPFTLSVTIDNNSTGGDTSRTWTGTATLTLPSGWTTSSSNPSSWSLPAVPSSTTLNWNVTPPASPSANQSFSVAVIGTPSGTTCGGGSQCSDSASLTGVNSVNPASLTASMTAAKTVGGGTLVKAGDSVTVSMAVANGAAPRASALTVSASALAVNATGNATATCGAGTPASASIAAAGSTTYTYTCTGVGGNGTLTFTGAANGTDENTAVAVGTGTATTNSITVDSTAPTPPSTPDLDPASDSGSSQTDNITNVKKPTFTGTDIEDGTTITLLVDGVANGTAVTSGNNWTITAVNNIADGTHNVTATATDSAGNVSAASSPLSITIDTAAPAKPSTPDMTAASDSGVSNTDDITNVQKPTFTGTAESGSTVTLLVDGVANGTGVATGGNWTITAATNITDGARSVTATAADVAGNTSAASSALSITIDTTNPATPSTPDMTAATDSGASNTDNITNVKKPAFTGTGENGSTVTLLVDGVANGTDLVTGGNWSITATNNIADGTHSVTASAADAAGNVSAASGALSITIDTLAPATPSIPDMTAATDSGSSPTDNITNVPKPAFTGTGEDGSTVTLMVDGAANGTGVVATGTWSITAATNIADGTHNITASAADTAGNTSAASNPLSITIDTVANAPSTPDLDPASDSGSSNTDNITNNTTPKFNGTAEKNASVQLFRGGSTSLGTVTADGSGNWTLTLAAALTDGTYSITAKQTDVAGNVSAASGALSLTIDTLAPTNAPTSPNLTGGDDTGISNTDNITSKTTNLTFQGMADPNVTVEVFEGATLLGTGTSNNGGNYNISAPGPFTEAVHSITAKELDLAGNVGPASTPHLVTIDITKPNVTINQAATQGDPAVAGPIHFTVMFNESAFGLTAGGVTLSGTAGATTAVITGSGANYDVAVSGMTIAGTVIASINAAAATDTAGNSNTASTSNDNIVTYNPDSKAPVVTVTFSAVDGQNGWYVHSPVLGTVSADDTTTGNSNVTAISCTDGVSSLPVGSPTGIGTHIASGSLSVSGEGTHNISCQATDSAGNSGAFTGSTNTATVKIDTVAPTGVAGTASRIPDHAGWYTSALTISFSGTDTTSGIASCSTTPYSGPDSAAASVLGHCTDNAGNSSADASFNLKFDSTAPTAVALSVTTGTPGANGWYVSDVTVSTTGTETVSGPVTCSADQSQSAETAGHVFNGSCTNAAGLSANAAPFTVKVDKTPPTATLAVTAGTLGDNGWYISDVTVDATGADTISSPVVCTPANQSLTTDSTGHTFSGSCTNDAGLSTNATDLLVKLDKTPPVVHITPDRATDHNNWYNHALSFTNPGTDATSGIASCTTPAAYSGPDGVTSSVAATCKDNAGNTGNGSFSFQFDATPPTSVAGAPNHGPNHNSWYNTAVDVVFTGVDATSDIESCSTINYSTPDTATASVMGHCTDNAGNSSANVASATFKFDATPPTAALAVTAGTPGANGWYVSDVTVGTSGTDTVSNPTTCTGNQFQTAETTGAAFNGACTNDAGLTTNAAPVTVKLDKTPPTGVTLTPSGTLGSNNWYTSDVNIKTSGIENISNPIVCTADQSQTTDTMGQVFHGSCTNDAGLPANASDITVKRDATPPVLTLAFSPNSPDGNNGWWKTPGGVPFSWTCSDATAGVDATYNGGCPSPLSGTVTANGTTNFADQVRDQAGNYSVAVNRDLMLDNVAPVVSWYPAGDSCSLPGNAGWCRGTQTGAFTSNDVTSGLAYPVQASFTQSTGTNGNPVLIPSGSVMDKAGNINAGVNAGPYKIDSVAPSITINSPNLASYILNAALGSNYSCTDTTSGVPAGGCNGPVASGANFSTNPVGAHAFTVNATDVAGNPATQTFNYGVFYSTAACLGSPGHAILQPIDLTGASVFPKKQGSTVPAKFRVCDANGVSIGTPGVVTDFKVIQIYNGTLYGAANEDPVSTTPDTMFRWTGDQWMFNISTKPLNAGSTYYYRISLNDGTFIDFDFGLR